MGGGRAEGTTSKVMGGWVLRWDGGRREKKEDDNNNIVIKLSDRNFMCLYPRLYFVLPDKGLRRYSSSMP